LDIALETHRRLYNACLQQRTDDHKVKYKHQSAWFKTQREVNPWFARLNFSSAQATMRRLDKAFNNFFRRVKEKAAKPGYPRRKLFGQFSSMEYPSCGDGTKLKNGKLYVQHVGLVRIKMHRPVEGTIKTVTLKKSGGKWFAIFSCELPDVPVLPSEKPAVGLDVGLTHFLTTSEGEKVENPKFLQKELKAFRRLQRSQSRKRLRGSNRKKANRRLSRAHARVANLRHNHHHQVAHQITHRFGRIAVESLNILVMVKNHRLSRAILDAAWGAFLNILKHHAAKAGVEFVEVDPKRTSQDCSRCGRMVVKDLSVRVHRCKGCGLTLCRDVNAARNILARAGPAWTRPVEVNVDQQVERPQRSRRLQPTE